MQRPGAKPFKTPDEAVDLTAFSPGAAATIGTPDDLIATIKNVLKVSGGFGTVVGFVHDWANPEDTFRSWDMVARYVVPEINGYLKELRRSQTHVIENRAVFDRAREAVMAKIMDNDAARAALSVTRSAMLSASGSNVPDIKAAKAANKAAGKAKASDDKARGAKAVAGKGAAKLAAKAKPAKGGSAAGAKKR